MNLPFQIRNIFLPLFLRAFVSNQTIIAFEPDWMNQQQIQENSLFGKS